MPSALIYSQPVEKITARQIAKLEQCTLSLVYRKIKAGEFGSYWTGPVRVARSAYIAWQNYTINKRMSRIPGVNS